jgi:hypothetical protein
LFKFRKSLFRLQGLKGRSRDGDINSFEVFLNKLLGAFIIQKDCAMLIHSILRRGSIKSAVIDNAPLCEERPECIVRKFANGGVDKRNRK